MKELQTIEFNMVFGAAFNCDCFEEHYSSGGSGKIIVDKVHRRLLKNVTKETFLFKML